MHKILIQFKIRIVYLYLRITIIIIYCLYSNSIVFLSTTHTIIKLDACIIYIGEAESNLTVVLCLVMYLFIIMAIWPMGAPKIIIHSTYMNIK